MNRVACRTMPRNAVGWIAAISIGIVGVVLVGDVALLGALPIVAIVAFIAVRSAAGLGGRGPADVRGEVRGHLLSGRPDDAAALLAPLLSARSASTRRDAATMLSLAAQAGASDPAVLDALPRLTELAPTYRIGRALIAHGRFEEAVGVLYDARDGHDPVAWAELVGALAALGRHEELAEVFGRAARTPPIEAIALAARRLDRPGLDVLRSVVAARAGADAVAAVVLDAGTSEAHESLTTFLAANQRTENVERAAWVAWAGAVLGSPVAIGHLERLVGRSVPGPTAVAIVLASLHAGRPDICLQIAATALQMAPPATTVALHLAQAQALVEVERPDEALGQLAMVPPDVALAAAITPPLWPAVREAESWEQFASHLAEV